jgi:hypothetical protein
VVFFLLRLQGKRLLALLLLLLLLLLNNQLHNQLKNTNLMHQTPRAQLFFSITSGANA